MTGIGGARVPSRVPRPYRSWGPALTRCEDGAAILEFALVLPLLLILVGGAFEIGRAVLIRESMVAAVRGGGRFLARIPDPSCRPVCSAAAERAAAITLDTIAANGMVRRTAVRVVPGPGSSPGTVEMRAEVRLEPDLLGFLDLDRAITLRATHQEPWIGE